MERTGPEALMLTAAIAGHRELDQFAQWEYSLADAPRVAALLLQDFEGMPAERPVGRRIRRWGAKLLRREAEEERLDGDRATESFADPDARPGAVLATSMAALPALDARRDGTFSPLSAAPRGGRA